MTAWFALPSWRKLGLFLGLALVLTAEFALIYGGCNWIASLREFRYRMYFGWELAAPFVPWMIYFYISLNLLTLLSLFVLSEEELSGYAKAIALSFVVAGGFFLVFPAELGFVRREYVPGYDGIFQRLFALDRPHNLVPSLHVTLSALTALVLWRGPVWFRGFVGVWTALICASVVLVHQHHLVDVLAGLALAWIVHRRIFQAEVS